MKATSKDSWINQLTEGKSYEVLDVHGYYILIVEDNNRKVWNYSKLFEISGKLNEDRIKYKFKTNWEVI